MQPYFAKFSLNDTLKKFMFIFDAYIHYGQKSFVCFFYYVSFRSCCQAASTFTYSALIFLDKIINSLIVHNIIKNATIHLPLLCNKKINCSCISSSHTKNQGWHNNHVK